MIHSCGSFPNLIKIVWVLIAKLQNNDIMVSAIHHYLKGGTKGQVLKNPFFFFFNLHNFVPYLCAGNFSILLLLILCVFKW